MALQIFHKRAENTHENEQFRRIAKNLVVLFNEMKWDGLLIGNPDNSDFRRFRADAILYYQNGLLIIDLKDYAGDIKLPPNSKEFRIAKWYIDTEKDSKRIEIKGGSRFINPFKQLESYRDSLIELIKSNQILSDKIDNSRICSINIFSGPINLNTKTPRDIPYYRIVQESDFQTFLYDFASPTNYYENIAEEWKRVFPSEQWVEKLSFKSAPENQPLYLELIDDNFKTIVSDFIQQPDNQILILESGDSKKRDGWMHYILTNAINFNIPQTDVWTHSTRIARRIKVRTGIEPLSLFSTIYGGNMDSSVEVERPEDEDVTKSIDLNGETPEQVQDVIGIKTDKELDNNSLIILSEAHLVTRSIFQTELLRFGSGRLLEDMLAHLKLKETQRRLICIGDPYSLGYGKESESALSKETLAQFYNGDIIKYRDKLDRSDDASLNKIRGNIIDSIDKGLFNNLHYEWDNKTLFEVDKPQAELLFQKWFKNSCEGEPEYAALVFKNKDALKISQWIRKNVQNKHEDYCQGDLLIANNSFNIPDEMGLSYPQRIQNGMYLRIESFMDKHDETITAKGRKPIVFKFVKLKVTCLSSTPNFQADIWILENYMSNSYELTLDEQIAFRVYISQKINEYNKENPFEKSSCYKNLISSQEYLDFSQKQKEIKVELESGKKVKTELKELDIKLRKLEREAKRRYKQSAMIHLLSSDSLINVALVQFGYAMNVHKALGSTFKEVLFNTFQGESFGVTNESYFRWLYTGISCGFKSIKIINPVVIHPLMNCVFEDTENITALSTELKLKTSLVFPNIIIHEKVGKFSTNEIPDNVKRGITNLIELLQPHGYELYNLITKAYLVKVIFSTPKGNKLVEKDNLIIAMNFNAKYEVSSVRIEIEGKSERITVDDCITKLASRAENENPNIDHIKKFRQETFQKWLSQCALNGYNLSLVDEQAYQSTFKIMKNGNHASFRVSNTLDGFFSKIQIFEKSCVEISNEIKELLLHGNKA